MNVTAIYDKEPEMPRRSRQKRNIRKKICCAVLIAIASTGLAFQKHEEAVMADDTQVYVVQDGDTIWDIARPVADSRGEDIREVIYQITVNNSLDPDEDIKPGQILTIK